MQRLKLVRESAQFLMQWILVLVVREWLITRLRLVPRLRMCGTIPPFSLTASWRRHGQLLEAFLTLTLTPLMWRIWRAHNYASKWQMVFNSAFKAASMLQFHSANFRTM